MIYNYKSLNFDLGQFWLTVALAMVAPAEHKYVIPAVFEDSHALTECCQGMGWCAVFFYT